MCALRLFIAACSFNLIHSLYLVLCFTSPVCTDTQTPTWAHSTLVPLSTYHLTSLRLQIYTTVWSICLKVFFICCPHWCHVMFRVSNTAISPPLCQGVCRLSGYPILGNQCQECHQCGAGLHDHGCWNKEEDGPWGHSWWRGEAQCEADPRHYCQTFIRRVLLREKPLPLWTSLPPSLPPPLQACQPGHHPPLNSTVSQQRPITTRQDREYMSHNMCMWDVFVCKMKLPVFVLYIM